MTNRQFSQEPTAMREELVKIAATTLGSKILAQHKEFFSNLAVDAVLRLKVFEYQFCKIYNIVNLHIRCL